MCLWNYIWSVYMENGKEIIEKGAIQSGPL